MTVTTRRSFKDRIKWLLLGLGIGILVLLAMVIPMRLLWLVFHAFGWVPSTGTKLLYAPPGGGGWLVLSSFAGITVLVVAGIAGALGGPTSDGEWKDLNRLQSISVMVLGLVMFLVAVGLLIAWPCELFWASGVARHLTVIPWFAIPLAAIATTSPLCRRLAEFLD